MLMLSINNITTVVGRTYTIKWSVYITDIGGFTCSSLWKQWKSVEEYHQTLL